MLITVEKVYFYKEVNCNEVSFKVKNCPVESFKMFKIILIYAKIFQLTEI